MENKTCPDCCKTKPIDNFALYGRNRRRKLCKDCYNNKQRNERKKTKYVSRITIIKRIRRYHRGYRRKVNTTHVDKTKQRKKFNETISVKVKNRIYNSLKQGEFMPETRLLLGYNIQTLRDHLQSQFTPEMNWDNYGIEWVLRYQNKMHNFDLTEPSDFRQYFALNNIVVRKKHNIAAANALLVLANK